MSDLTASMGWSLDGFTIHPLPGGKSKPIDISNSIVDLIIIVLIKKIL